MSDAVSHETNCFREAIEHQVALKLAGRRKLVRHGGTLCSGCYQEPPLPGQRYGARCHRTAVQKSYYKKQKRLKALEEQQKLSRGVDDDHQSEGPRCGDETG